MIDTPEEIPAATLVIFRRGSGKSAELLMVVRSRQLSFAGGAAVFPGGRVDAEDRQLAAGYANSRIDQDEAAHRIAAVRETLEETGLVVGMKGDIDAERAVKARDMLLQEGALQPVLDALQWTIDLHALTPFARWLPRGMSHNRIFDTRFYLADLGTGAVDITVDATENTRLFWTTAADALNAADRGEISIIFPTRRNLERLAQFDDFDSVKAHAEKTPMRMVTPQIVEADGQQWLTIDDDLGYPVTRERVGSAMRG